MHLLSRESDRSWKGVRYCRRREQQGDTAHSENPPSGSYILSIRQEQSRLPAQPKYRVVDVHVASGSDEGVRIYESAG